VSGSRPRIGLTLDADEARRRYELGTSYVDAVLLAGGLPILLPHTREAAAPQGAPTAERGFAGSYLAAYLALLDGLVVTGGAFDVPPELYGEARRPECGATKPERTAFERDLLEAALAARLPVLGVCGGMQLLNVVRGGSLYQDLVADAGLAGHEQPPPKDAPSHVANLVPGTQLAALVGAEPLGVNSTHHQAVKVPGAGVLVSARAPDGVVEAIELPDLRFALGVQWHPEAVVRHEPRHAAIYRGLVAAARDARR
jgi:putative glutamine amidotransferase